LHNLRFEIAGSNGSDFGHLILLQIVFARRSFQTLKRARRALKIKPEIEYLGAA
jgi:hypothetical protein